MARGSDEMATLERERAAISGSMAPVAGVDEAGRGPWAGPVVAAAVILDPDDPPAGIADSKLLTAVEREEVLGQLQRRRNVHIGVGIAEVERIDRDNILQATLWAMSRAVETLAIAPRLVLIDGNRAPRLAMATETVVGGDRLCLSIAAASIVAKVTRDRLMADLATVHPGYGFERHKGYGTPEHRAALAERGVTPIHRRSFRPVRAVIDASDVATAGASRRGGVRRL
jgi:ribonuclease HII